MIVAHKDPKRATAEPLSLFLFKKVLSIYIYREREYASMYLCMYVCGRKRKLDSAAPKNIKKKGLFIARRDSKRCMYVCSLSTLRCGVDRLFSSTHFPLGLQPSRLAAVVPHPQVSIASLLHLGRLDPPHPESLVARGRAGCLYLVVRPWNTSK